MIEAGKIKKYLRQELSSKRYKHSINVSETAAKLAARYCADVHKASLAGLVHDCTREMATDIQLMYIEKSGVKPDSITLEVKELLHGQSAVFVCKELFQIEDVELLSAVRYHTTGKENMSILEKIVFLADYIEPSRSFKGVEEIRELAFVNIDSALFKALDYTIVHIVSKSQLIHPDTIAARNYIIQRMGMLA